MTCRVPSLAKNFQSPHLKVQNRFACLEDEHPDEFFWNQTPDVPETTQNSSVKEAIGRKAQIGHVTLDKETTEHDLLRIEGKIDGRKAWMLINSGSTHDFISLNFARKKNLEIESQDGSVCVSLANGWRSHYPSLQRDVKVVVDSFSQRQTFMVIPLANYDVILGKPWLFCNNPAINFRKNKINIGGNETLVANVGTPSLDTDPMRHSEPEVELNFISGRQARHAMRNGEEGFMVWVTDLQEEAKVNFAATRSEHSVPSPDDDRMANLQELLHEYRDTIPDELPARLPPERQIDNEIDLEPESKPPSRRPYRLSQPALNELQRQLTSLLEKGFIQPSKSPFGAPVFFVKKADGSLRLVSDWRDLNRITVKNEACMPNVDDLFDTVQGSRFFTKLDLHSGYNQVRIRTEDIPKTAINTPLGHFEFKVMGFGLCNAPATFQAMMNLVLRPHLRKFVVVFLDDILIFSKTWDEHLDHIRIVLQTL